MTNQTITLVQDFFLQQPTGPQFLSSNTIFGNKCSKHDTFNHGLSTYPPPNTPNSQPYDQGLWKPLVSLNVRPAIRTHISGKGSRLVNRHKLWRSKHHKFIGWVHLRKFKVSPHPSVQNLCGMIFLLWTNSESQKENPNIFPGDVLAFNFLLMPALYTAATNSSRLITLRSPDSSARFYLEKRLTKCLDDHHLVPWLNWGP